jgi:hypothetical protein
MNLFNRIVIILLILAAMLLVPLVLIFPEQAEYALRYAADVIQANLVWLDSLGPTAEIGVRMLLGGAGLLAFVIGLVFLALEVIRIRRKTVRLKDGSGELMMDGISGHVAYYVDLLSDVLRVKPTVVSKGKAVEAHVFVETAPGINIPAKTAEIKETARRVIEEELGLQLKGEVKVRVKPVYPKHDASRKRTQKRTLDRTTRLPDAAPLDEETPSEGAETETDMPAPQASPPDGALEEPASELIEVKTQVPEEAAEE